MLLVPTCWKNIYLTYSKNNFYKLPSCNVKKMYLSYTPKSPFFVGCLRATFQDLVLCGVIFETRMCFCPPALWTSGPRHLPPLSPNSIEIRVFRATEGFTQFSLSSLVLYIRRAVDYSRQHSSTSLDNFATTPNFQTILPIFYGSTLLYTHDHARLTREGIFP